MRAYDPGDHKVAINLSANENPYDLPEGLKAKIIGEAGKLAFNRYPDSSALDLRRAIADRYGVEVENIAVGNGGDELLLAMLLAYGGPGRTAASFEPTFVMYSILSELTGTGFARFERARDFGLPKKAFQLARSVNAELTFLCSPNNPSGNVVDEAELKPFLVNNRNLVVVDEAYQEFSRTSVGGLLTYHPNLVVIRTFSKAFSLAGLRVGYLLAAPEVVINIMKVKLPYNVNAFSQAAATVLMQNRAEFDPVIKEILAERNRVFEAISGINGLKAYPSAANFILIKSRRPAATIWRRLLAKGILVRNFAGAPGLDNCLRITIGSPAQNDAVIAALKEN